MLDEAMRLAERLVTWCPMPMCDACLVAGALIALKPLVEAAEKWNAMETEWDGSIEAADAEAAAHAALFEQIRAVRSAR